MATKKKTSKKFTPLEGIKTIADGITSEKLSAMFFDAKELKKQPDPLYRLDSHNHRYYYRFNKEGEPEFFTSVTTLIKNTLPTSNQVDCKYGTRRVCRVRTREG